jgi:hypothetical protein
MSIEIFRANFNTLKHAKSKNFSVVKRRRQNLAAVKIWHEAGVAFPVQLSIAGVACCVSSYSGSRFSGNLSIQNIQYYCYSIDSYQQITGVLKKRFQ